jgi:hypothetical protein
MQSRSGTACGGEESRCEAAATCSCYLCTLHKSHTLKCPGRVRLTHITLAVPHEHTRYKQAKMLPWKRTYENWGSCTVKAYYLVQDRRTHIKSRSTVVHRAIAHADGTVCSDENRHFIHVAYRRGVQILELAKGNRQSGCGALQLYDDCPFVHGSPLTFCYDA